MSNVFTTKPKILPPDECTYVESTNNMPTNYMAQWDLLNVVNSVILKFSAVLKFPADDLQFPVIVFSLWKHSNVIFNYNNYYLLIINYYYNNKYEKSQ